jgi:hypothetical protein
MNDSHGIHKSVTNGLAEDSIVSRMSASNFPAVLFLATCMHSQIFAAEPAPPAKVAPKQQLMRLEFNPGGGPWSGETAFQGASWSALGPGPGRDNFMQASAGLGDRFPVQDKHGVTHFEVIVENGVDDHLVVLITSADVEQRVRLPRDKPAKVTVAGNKYTLLFPTNRVAAAPGERPSTNKARIFITREP